MKTVAELNQLIAIETKIRKSSLSDWNEIKKAKERTEFLQECILLIEQGLTDESIKYNIEKLTAQFKDIRQRHRQAFYEKKELEENQDKWNTKKFYSSTGAGKIKKQLKTYIFLQ